MSDRVSNTDFRCLSCSGDRQRRVCRKGRITLVRCRDCGFVQQHPAITVAEAAALYAVSTHGTRACAGQDVLLPRERSILASVAERGAEGPLLDVGAGGGLMLRAALDRGWQATGIELCSADAARIAEELGIEVQDVTLADADLPAGHFGTVTFIHSLEHVLDPLGDLKRAAALLRPGGWLHVAVPNWRSFERTVAGAHVAWIGSEHVSYFDRSSMADMLERSGFEPVHWETRSYPGPNYTCFFACVRRLGLEWALQRWMQMGDHRLEELMQEAPPITCPVWRLRFLDRVARRFLGLWPHRILNRRGRGDELRVTARLAG